MEPLNRSQLSSSLESGTLTKELVASATINGVPLQPVTVCPHARMALACGFRLSGLMLLRELKVEDWGTVRSGQATVSSRSLSQGVRQTADLHLEMHYAEAQAAGHKAA